MVLETIYWISHQRHKQKQAKKKKEKEEEEKKKEEEEKEGYIKIEKLPHSTGTN